MDGKPWYKHVTKIVELAREYDDWIQSMSTPSYVGEDNFKEQLMLKAKYYSDEVAKIKTKNPATINKLIEYSLGLNIGGNYKESSYKSANKYGIKVLNLLYRANPTVFLSNFC